MVAVLTAFVAGVVLLQQFAALPGGMARAAGAALGIALFGGAAAVRRLPGTARGACLAMSASGALCLGMVYAASMAQIRLQGRLPAADEGADIEVVGLVASLPSREQRGCRFGFDVERVLTPGRRVPAHLALAWYRDGVEVRPGERWQFTVRLRRPHGNYNPGGFDSELWMLEEGLGANGHVRESASAPAPVLVSPDVRRFGTGVERLRDGVRERMSQALGDRRYAGVVIALVMGDQAAIRPDDWILFNRTGISHLVSISGLHITMIGALAALAAGAAWRGSAQLVAAFPVPLVRAAAGVIGAWLYCLLAGWGVPAQRTFVMLAAVGLAQALRLRLSAPTVLASAAAAVCLWDPWAVTAPGFWLSFGAVACIFYSQAGRGVPTQAGDDEAPGAARRLVRAMAEASRVQAVITVGLVPLTLVLFSQISLVSPAANAVAIPLVSYAVTPLALAGALCCAIGGLLWGPGCMLLAGSEMLFHALASLLQWLVQWPWAWVAMPAPPVWTIALCVAGIAWLWAPPGWPLRWIGVAWMAPALVWPQDGPQAGGLWVTALDVGQGMSLVLETSTTTLVFDTGPRIADDADAGARIVVPYLRARGISRVRLLVVSHLDADHSGGARSLIRQVAVGQVLTSIRPDHPILGGFADVMRCERGQTIGVGDLRVRVLGPEPALYEARRVTTNAQSCVLRVDAGRTRVLLTGDVPARQERSMVAAGAQELEAELMVAPHHGSRTSSSEEFIRAIGPQWVCIQAGYRSRFGHPDPAVVARYEAMGVMVVRSDWAGAARWRFAPDGSSRLERWRQDHGRYWTDQPQERALAVRASVGQDGGTESRDGALP